MHLFISFLLIASAMMPMPTKSLSADFSLIKADYKAAAPSRYWRTRTGLGGSADAHMTQSQFWNMREYSRDMDRNDCVVGQMIDRAIDNIVGPQGLSVEPQTPDKNLNKDLWQMFNDWATNPVACSANKRFTFGKIQRMALRHRFIDGDHFVLPLESGALQLVEGDRCITPTNTSRNVVHGILIDNQEAPVEFWFSKQKRRDAKIDRVAEVERYQAYDADGYPQVFQLFDAKRVTQTRGTPVFAPVFDLLTMFEDVNFAKLVQAQVVSCIGLFIERDEHFKGAVDTALGPRTTQPNPDDSTTLTLEKMRPGMVVKGRKGEKAAGLNANVPNAEYFDHVRLILRIVGINIGMPLTLSLLDTAETTFHGYRGELNEARKGFKRIRQDGIEQLNSPVYCWKVREWLAAGKLGEVAERYMQQGSLTRHKWIGEGWPYVDPKSDVQADVIALESMIDSPRQLHARQGRDSDDIRTETIEDNGKTIEMALQKAQELNIKFPEGGITWRDVLRPMGKVQISKSEDEQASASDKKAEAKS